MLSIIMCCIICDFICIFLFVCVFLSIGVWMYCLWKLCKLFMFLSYCIFIVIVKNSTHIKSYNYGSFWCWFYLKTITLIIMLCSAVLVECLVLLTYWNEMKLYEVSRPLFLLDFGREWSGLLICMLILLCNDAMYLWYILL